MDSGGNTSTVTDGMQSMQSAEQQASGIVQESPEVIQSQPQPQGKSQEGPSAAHLLYAVEMLAFAVIGWAWLAVRELMGDTPVMDVAVMLSLLVCSAINLLFALLYHTTDQFKGLAQAFINHTVCLWLLYAFSYAQSTTDGRGSICCVVDGNRYNSYSLRLTYKAAYFGGLTLHQPAAAITLSFLSIFLLLAAAQAKACKLIPIEWPLDKAPLVMICLLGFLQGMFGLKAPVCKDQDMSGAAIAVAVMAWALAALNFPWLYKEGLGYDAKTKSGFKYVDVFKIIQVFLEIFFTFLVGLLAALTAVNLGSGEALLLFFAFALLWQAGGIIKVIYDIQNPPNEDKKEEMATVAAQFPQFSQFSHLRHPSPSMLLPGVRELRRARDNKRA
jgi:hypothetical protein